MANVKFLRGTQANLDTLISGSGERFQDGAFYLTSDTDRLYVAQSASELVELNKSITTVDEVANLPTGSAVADGQFYYAIAENILCVYKASGVTGAPKWVQINPDTTDGNDYVSGFSISKDTSNTDSSKLKYNWSMIQKDIEGNEVTSHALTGSFEIAASDIVQLGGVAVDVDATAGSDNNSAIVALGGSGADTAATAGKVTIKGEDNVDISVSGNTVTIKADDTTYALSSATDSTSIALATGDGTASGSVAIKADDTYLSVDGSTANEVTVNHKTQSGVTVGSYGESGKAITHRGKTDTVSDGMKFKVPKVTVDKAGHITAISEETFTIPVDNDTEYTVKAATAGTGDNKGKLTITINNGDKDISATSGQILYNKITVDGTEVTKYNTESLGSFYSASEIDKKLNAIDALTYKGTVGGTGATVSALPTSGVKIGDTYKVAVANTYAGVNASVGDLFIATGTETNGVITSNLTWTYIESGADADTQYTMSVDSNKITLTDNINSGTQSVEIDGGTALTATTSGAVTGKNAKITINHDTSGVTAGSYGPSADASVSYGGTFSVPSVTVDAQGHVTAASDKTITLPASEDTTYRLVGDNTDKSITLKDSDNKTSGSLTFTSGNAITVTMSGNDATTDDAAAESKSLEIKHSNVTRTDDSSNPTATPKDYGEYITAVTGITSNDQGHITKVTYGKFQLPAAEGYSVVAATTTSSNKFALTGPSNAAIGSIAFASSSYSDPTAASGDKAGGIKITSSVSGTQDLAVNIDLEWGSF